MKIVVALLVVLIACLQSNVCVASENKALYDSSNVTIRLPEKTEINDYKNKSDFKYSVDYRETQSLWERFVRFIVGLFGEMDEKTLNKIVALAKLLRWPLLALIVIAIAYFVFRKDLSSLFSKNKTLAQELKTKNIDLTLDNETLRGQLDEAIARKDYKEAVRLFYNITLKGLNDASLIQFRGQKTNSQYIREVNGIVVKEPFKNLTYYFEYIFYGDFEASEFVFNKTKEHFSELEDLISKIKK